MVSSRPVSTSRLPTAAKIRGIWQQWRRRGFWKLVLAGIWLLAVSSATGFDLKLVRFWERQFQTLFFEMRGPVLAPNDIVILAMDDESFSQAEHYSADPERYAELAPIRQFPWERRAYAIAIEKLLEAGARAVAIDVLLLSPSTYGPQDDQALAAVLERYGDRVVLAGTYDDAGTQQGLLLQPSFPVAPLLNTPVQVGTVNVLKDADARVHRLGDEYLAELARKHGDLNEASQIEDILPALKSFAAATLDVAGINYPPPAGPYINYRGPHRSFEHLPFWYVLDNDPWQNRLNNGAYFKDKLVLIGPTASSLQDFHPAPFSETLLYSTSMTGVEIQANAIATLRSGSAIRDSLAAPSLRGLLVLGMGTGFGVLLWWVRRPVARLGWTLAVSSLVFGTGYLVFFVGQMFLPVAMPIASFLGIGGVYIITDIITEQLRKQQLRNTLARYATSPIVQEIISQQDDFQDLMGAREAEVIGLVLYARYRIVKLLGTGGFGETYVAEDTQRPGSPVCVVKQLKIVSDDPATHDLAHRLFSAEAETLERLGHHAQIPRLLAYFEANYAFYLVEEMIDGRLLRSELASRRPRSQNYVLKLLQDLLPVVGFVHGEGVIHRDIKPANIIRRQSDQRLVLIDFGAVKQISNQLADTRARKTSTVGIGTQGYMPSEQSAGLPGFYSDIYALGVTAIEALTGIPAYAIKRSPKGELLWQHEAPNAHPQLVQILATMVRYDFNARYSSAWAVLEDLNAIAPEVEADDRDDDLDEAEDLDADLADAEISTHILAAGWQVEAEITSED